MEKKLQKTKRFIVNLLGSWIITGVFMIEWSRATHDQENYKIGFLILLSGCITALLAWIMFIAGKLIHKSLIWLKKAR